MDRFANAQMIGEGTFGKVYVANDTKTNTKVAVKKIKLEKNGVSLITIRELKILKLCNSQHIIKLYECYIADGSFYMVLEYLPFDLSALFLSKYRFSDDQIKNLTYQLLHGLSYLHERGIIHRDVKSSNILLTHDGLLKIADFGLSKYECRDMTNQVCTLWYRAPELLLGENNYDNRVDTWSVGCILLEFKVLNPVFSENNEVLQIARIFKLLGAPLRTYKYSSLFEQEKYVVELPWGEIIERNFGRYFHPDFLYLIGLLLNLDFSERISCTDAMKLPIFNECKCNYTKIELKDIHDTIIRSKLRERYKTRNKQNDV
ncbi:Cdc2-related protein kinase [Trachipleistophora hominis]|uniref:Cdc2-related protein kinase n=1 Tax=Trachipleistophora hominis TaxID=72359 RepID=L7JZF1_TRAHO|nr:Cdc2-related protein kinase [Trachipleistophora hominis]